MLWGTLSYERLKTHDDEPEYGVRVKHGVYFAFETGKKCEEGEEADVAVEWHKCAEVVSYAGEAWGGPA